MAYNSAVRQYRKPENGTPYEPPLDETTSDIRLHPNGCARLSTALLAAAKSFQNESDR